MQAGILDQLLLLWASCVEVLMGRVLLSQAEVRPMPDVLLDFSLLIHSSVPPRSFKAGDVIFHQGDHPSELYVIQSGRVNIQIGDRPLATLERHDIFGEMALIDTAPRSATAVAATDVTLIPVSEKQFLFLVSQTPFFALNAMRVLARRLRSMDGYH
jgi:CRP/FNR family transcriptional regulator, cyclic AMP receptor protein